MTDGPRRAFARAWGPPGNERLTTSVGLVLLVLLAVETLTTLSLGSFLPVHIFLGLVLPPPIALKLGSTGSRFVRYYTGSKPYRLKGPPLLLMRLLAPLLVASTLTLLRSADPARLESTRFRRARRGPRVHGRAARRQRRGRARLRPGRSPAAQKVCG
jgi:hypothetical protein